MEKFYIAEEGSKLREDYLKHRKDMKKLFEVKGDFFKEFNIKATEFGLSTQSLSIVATDEDKENFKDQLCKPKNGVHRFRANSKINKAWVATLELHDIKNTRKPRVPFYFDRCYGGRMSSKLFQIDGVVYCSFNAGWEFKPIDKLTEIKASEFFKVIEDQEKNESKQSASKE